jgi:RNA polymerase sigma-70 factor (ECF subfamily)
MVKEREEEQNNKRKSDIDNEINIEKELIEKIKDGNTELFSKIIDKYQKKVLVMVRRYIHDKDDVDDALQEIFIKIFKNIDSFKFNSNFSTWIYRIVINHCLELKRKLSSKKNLNLAIDYEEDINELKSEFKTPEQNIEDEEMVKQIKEIINTKLSKKQKSVFIMKYLDNLSIKEIGYILKMKEGTVKTHLSRSYEKIREEFKKEFYEK